MIGTKASISAVAALAAAALMVGCGESKWDDNAQPTRNDALAQQLATDLLTNVSAKNAAELTQILAPNWQLQRGSGAGIDRSQFLGKLPDLRSFKILPPVLGLEYGNTLTATYRGETNLVVDGKPYKTAPNPYISVFVKSGDGQWHLVGHGNFNKPK
jgi:hypothetical protein